MLVLSRKPGEKLVINGDIIVTITEIAGGKVRIGIDAPQDVKILRSELTDRMPTNAFESVLTGLDHDFSEVAPTAVKPVHHPVPDLPSFTGNRHAPRLRRIPR